MNPSQQEPREPFVDAEYLLYCLREDIMDLSSLIGPAAAKIEIEELLRQEFGSKSDDRN